MELLKTLEQIRTPFFDQFFLLITKMGEELFFTVIILAVIWCIDKKSGYRMFFIFTLGSFVNQMLKLIFKIPRPWTYENAAKPVEGSVEAATGYSFPSGHTQQGVSLFGSIAMFLKKSWVYIFMAVLTLLVAFSRMYLGVHTPIDVFTSLAVGIALLLLCYFIFRVADKYKYGDAYLYGIVAIAITIAMIILSFDKTGSVEYLHGIENGWKLLGCCIGIIASIIVDTKYTHFEVKAKWWQQAIKLAVGLGIVIVIKTFLKQPLLDLFNQNPVADGIRYLLIILFAGCLYPMSFRIFKKKA
ncbi:MAG TPA: phosphatase PAP2 family protein [Clostridia bacterium]|jgi:undecaprenyl-diphosphatase|nr:MAG: Undecaprenyl-diphosphatase BcrC [Firmicutes bacterium ADurb.Bin146]HOD92768.1 phosphatase PAP2 family protein [Clostridia bacterium]HQM39538.1 phosphatase PAP2 family protein [Clostridia bacterium]